MKILIKCATKLGTLPFQSASLEQINNGFITHLKDNQESLDCFYGVDQNSGFGILNLDSIEQAWSFVMQNPMYPYWNVEVTALANPIVIAQEFNKSTIKNIKLIEDLL